MQYQCAEVAKWLHFTAREMQLGEGAQIASMLEF